MLSPMPSNFSSSTLGFSTCLCIQGLSCRIFSYLEHPWRGSSLWPCRSGVWRMS